MLFRIRAESLKLKAERVDYDSFEL